jgi:ribosomal protein S18 acetylase RimI-like enzyme/predicted nucleotidyltransferase
MSATPTGYPGTAQHQAMLGAIVDFYADDPRVLAISVFGSLGRGDWRPDSDLDLDVVVADSVRIEIEAELHRLSAAFEPLGERAALIMPHGADNGDVVLESLLQLSVRYHPLADTNPNILSGLRVLGGQLGYAEMEAAARANQRPTASSPPHPVDECLHYSITAERALRAERLWLAVELIHLARGLLIGLFWRKQGGIRPIHTFDAEAPAELQALLGTTLPALSPASIRMALGSILDILEHHLEPFADDRTRLTGDQRSVLGQLRKRLGAGGPAFTAVRLRNQELITIRIARPSDSPRLAPLLHAFGGPRARVDELAERIAACAGREVALLGELNDSLVGFAFVEVRTAIGDGSPRAELTDLYVLDQYQRHGIGRALLRAAEVHAQTHGADTLFLLTGHDNSRAQAFYRALGYDNYALALHRSLP